ncbi:DUF6924 domain-containing protein [Paractinoplanes lichenicola]|uniref:DUF6924 domain-containing protein n=1 Tax=Paractinoplanes lichenicola TaxID=2802976 RepID=A0ABS1VNW7_9ACTN|nr:hypothetical protein [Actinoplanes lichenicola]MBL7255824.1 hypothetical protein [Actinoplanes lichenicola]
MNGSLPEPEDLTSLVLRTDFADDRAWAALREAVGDDDATFVDDRRYEGVTVAELVEADRAAPDVEKVVYVFLADGTTMTDAERPLLAVDLHDGRTLRLPPRWFEDMSANLCLGNVDFDEFAGSADESGTYRGVGG